MCVHRRVFFLVFFLVFAEEASRSSCSINKHQHVQEPQQPTYWLLLVVQDHYVDYLHCDLTQSRSNVFALLYKCCHSYTYLKSPLVCHNLLLRLGLGLGSVFDLSFYCFWCCLLFLHRQFTANSSHVIIYLAIKLIVILTQRAVNCMSCRNTK